ncbi:Rv1157c family protein [Corynebacterium sp. H78]|uniref:Rv1157c family protein n=1 Tax=Corynebacterium sp. H78 TaxID=3133417 RepID=UPI0030A3463D
MVYHRRTLIRRTAVALGASALLFAGAVPSAGASPSLDFAQAASPNVYGTVRDMVNQPGVPAEIRDGINKAIDFLTGEGGGEPGFEVPENGPATVQFAIPTAAENCIDGQSRSIGLATAVPGPAPLPLPGVGEGQTGFIFTGLGTKELAPHQNTSMRVHWINAANGNYGTTELTNNGINAESGPSTVNGTANTGNGLVIAFLEGGITANESSGPADCNYTPTAAAIPVGMGQLPATPAPASPQFPALPESPAMPAMPAMPESPALPQVPALPEFGF